MRRPNPDAHSQNAGRRLAPTWPKVLPGLTVLLLVLSLTVFWSATPGGLLRKADMVGYAVCHQIASHSFTVAGRQLPLCARCTGTFLGALVGLVGQAFVLQRRRAAAFPSPPILAILVCFTLAWIGDGVNSYLQLIGGAHLYDSTNSLRLITGTLNGLTMSSLVYPILNVSLWQVPLDRPAVRGLRDLAVLLLMESLVVLLVQSGWDALLYPLALLSAAGVLTLLTSVNSVIAVIVLHRENSVENWRQFVMPVAIGVVLSFIQIGAIDLIRYALTGTLEGIPTIQ